MITELVSSYLFVGWVGEEDRKGREAKRKRRENCVALQIMDAGRVRLV